MTQCEFCGKSYEARKTGPGPRSSYCSRLCRIRRLYGHNHGEFAQEHTCEYCGKALNYPIQRRFCSLLCTREHKRKGEIEKACEQCGKMFSSHIPHKKYCSTKCSNKAYRQRSPDNPNKPRYAFVCKHCGKDYQTAYKDRNTYCSRECSFKDKERRCACGASLRGTGKERCDQCDPTPTIKQCVCVICGKAFEATRARRYCSRACELEKGRRYYRATFVSVVETNPVVVRKCMFCGKEYETNNYALKRKFCSSRCANKHGSQSNHHRRRERRKRQQQRRTERERKPAGTELVYRAKIFERDGWRCQICGKKVDPKLTWPNLKSATIDHIVPLAQGGIHEPRNCQLAHFICNSRKSDYGVFQPRLIG